MAKTRTIVICGAGRGIGAMTAVDLGRRGYHVFVVGLPHEEKELRQVARDAGNLHAWAIADVRDRGQMDAAMARALQVMGRIDIVMANAGIARQMPTDDAEFSDELRLTLEVNLFGVVNS